jgi:hypothetical protein
MTTLPGCSPAKQHLVRFSAHWPALLNAGGEVIRVLCKARLNHDLGPGKTQEAVEMATPNWASWFHHHRLMEGLGYNQPDETGASYSSQLNGQVAHEE